ncbi:MAG: hypothetical protein J5806_07915 [Lentisphaeria bacterium]|nr:hypothetical protein [Lentisphaeria bacterium]
MSEYKFVEDSLQLEMNIYGVRNRLLLFRLLLNMLNKKLENKNDEEAYRIWMKYWHRHNHEFEVFKNFSPLEIFRVIRNRQTLRNISLQLLKAGQNLNSAVLKVRSWRYNIEIAANAYELFLKGGQQRHRQEYDNAISRINQMQEAKADLQKVMNLMNQMVQTFNLPFVTQMVSMYTKIFDELCRFCDKVADYAKTIEREAEKVLGAKGEWNQALNNSNSYFNLRLQMNLESKQK